MTNTKVGRTNELDVLRGLAVLSVVFYHYTTRYGKLFGRIDESYFLDFKYGGWGVQLFFMISGYVIYMTTKNCKSVKEFAIKRIIRLYPAFLFALPLTFIIVGLYHLEGRQVSISEALLNLTMIYGYLPKVRYVDGAYWSLTVEISFYLVIGALLYTKMIKNIIYVSIAWLATAALFETDVLVSFKYFSFLMYKIGIFELCDLFIAGMMFYQIKNNNKLIYHVILGLVVLFNLVFKDYQSTAFLLVFYTVFYALVFDKLKFLGKIKFLTFIGTISYSLYLVHQNIGYVVINFLENHGFTHEIYILIPLAVSFSLASLITFYIENPIQDYLRRKFLPTKQEPLPYSNSNTSEVSHSTQNSKNLLVNY